jgi:hypothetical protein
MKFLLPFSVWKMYVGPFVRSHSMKTLGYLERGWVGQQERVWLGQLLERFDHGL